jgi:DNA (cytosine-5)-methyltransferase 1
MSAYYNEIDPYAAQWLRNLILAGHIAPGVVDERSITHVPPEDLLGFSQCHFFAGIGVWSHALRLAGWPDDRPVWTGSCPCQPFSVAGRQNGVHDARHLWPTWHALIAQCRPPVVFGEQVEAAIRHGWLDVVQDDMENLDYAFGAVGLPAACVGAPHIRQRLWFVAYRDRERRDGVDPLLRSATQGRCAPEVTQVTGGGRLDGVAHPHDAGLEGRGKSECGGPDQCLTGQGGVVVGMAHACGERRQQDAARALGHKNTHGTGLPSAPGVCEHGARPAHGVWANADWLLCQDGRWRSVEPGTFPLAHGAPARVGRLRAYGNAIVPQVAAEVIKVFMAYRP